MLLRWFALYFILFADIPCLIRGVPLNKTNASDDNEVMTEIQSNNQDVVIGDNVVEEASNKIGDIENPDKDESDSAGKKSTDENGETSKSTEDEPREGKAARNNIRDQLDNLLDETFETVDFSGAITSADGTKECVNKTVFVETTVSDR